MITRWPRPDELVATTRLLDHEPDLVALGTSPDGVLWTSDHGVLAGTGVALRITRRGPGTDEMLTPEAGPDPVSTASTLSESSHRGAEVSAILGAIETDDPLGVPGSGPVAFAALPFAPDAPGTLVVPRRTVAHRQGRLWETVVELRPGVTGAFADQWRAQAGPRLSAPRDSTAGATPPDGFTLSSPLSHAAWQDMIVDAVATIRAGNLAKVVLARRVDVVANRPFLVGDVISRLRALYPTCMIFHIGGFIGASPELLVRREGDRFASHPLAGTVARSGDRTADDALVAGLLASSKDRWEHQIVIDQLSQALAPWCETLAVPDTPTVMGLRNVSHLATLITARLAARDGRLPTALELVDAIHPTAAVGGHPTPEAVRYLQKVEGFDRGPYAGPVGWVDSRGDGAWALGLRSAWLEGERASMFAGVGVVAESDARAELAETQLKLQALLAALVRP
ncbi:MAG: isochorismate synthase [Actinomycetota bacterium]|nr:isochorismate synthase [Actinomycetota bacterium]